MNSLSVRFPAFALVTVLTCALTLPPVVVAAEGGGASGSTGAAQAEPKRKYKKARALTPSIGKRMQALLELLQPEDPAVKPDLHEALALLEQIRILKKKSSYDRAVMWNYFAYVYFSLEQYPKALHAYQSLLAEEQVTESLALQAYFSIAQILMIQERYGDAIPMLLRWFALKEEPPASAWALLGQAYYQVKNIDEALRTILIAIDIKDQAAEIPRENWFQIVLAIYQTRKDIPKTMHYLVRLIEHYPKKSYWKQLAYYYGETKRVPLRLSTYEAAYRQNLFDQESEYQAMAQLYMQADVPFKSSKVIKRGFERKIVKRTYKNLRAIADYLRAAHEISDSIQWLELAAKESDNGNDYTLLGNLYLLEDKYKRAIRSLKRGIAKGNLKHPIKAKMALAQAHFELQQFDSSIREFKTADVLNNRALSAASRSIVKTQDVWQRRRSEGRLRGIQTVQRQIAGWLKHVSNEQKNMLTLKLELKAAEEKLRRLRKELERLDV